MTCECVVRVGASFPAKTTARPPATQTHTRTHSIDISHTRDVRGCTSMEPTVSPDGIGSVGRANVRSNRDTRHQFEQPSSPRGSPS